MLLYKIYCHLVALICKWYYRLNYGPKLQLGKNFQFRKGFTLLVGESGGVRIGDNVFFNNYCTICILDKLTIGDGTIFGENVKIYDHNHIYSNPDMPIKQQGYTSAAIHIGRHCWIGSNVMILKGVTIGDNSIIGAGCVVYQDIPSNTRLLNKQEFIVK